MSVELGSAYGKIEIDGSGARTGAQEAAGALNALTVAAGTLIERMAELGVRLVTDVARGLVDFGRSSVIAAAEAEEAQASLNATIQSTGGIAGVTADMVNKLASAYQETTKFEDDLTVGAADLLLTFTNINKDVFPDTLEAVLDISTKMKQDLKSSAVQVGKALNDPITGLTALKRVGVSFNDEQEKMIKRLQDSDHLMEAQKIILQELQREFGGSAEAAGKTFAGQMAILNNEINDVKEDIGAGLIPIVTEFTLVVKNLLPFIKKLAGSELEDLRKAFDDLLAPVRDFFLYIDAGYSVAGAFKAMLKDYLPADLVVLFEKLSTEVDKLFKALKDNDPKAFFESLSEIGKTLGEPIREALGGLSDNIAQWIKDDLPKIVDSLGTWGTEFTKWLIDVMPDVEEQLGLLAEDIGQTFLDDFPKVQAKLKEWGGRFWGFVDETVVPALTENMNKVTKGIADWFADTENQGKLTKLGQDMGNAILDGLDLELSNESRYSAIMKKVGMGLLKAVYAIAAALRNVGYEIAQTVLEGLGEKLFGKEAMDAVGKGFVTALLDSINPQIPPTIEAIVKKWNEEFPKYWADGLAKTQNQYKLLPDVENSNIQNTPVPPGGGTSLFDIGNIDFSLSIATALAKAGAEISNFFVNAGVLWDTGWQTIRLKLDEVWTGMVTTVTEKFTGMKETITQQFLDTWNTVNLDAQTVMEQIKATVTARWEDVKAATIKGIADVVTAIQGKIAEWKKAGENLVNGLVEGLKSQLTKLEEVAAQIAKIVTDTMSKIWDMKSPSGVTRGMGVNLGRGLVAGLESMMPVIEAAVQRMAIAPEVSYGSGRGNTAPQQAGAQNMYFYAPVTVGAGAAFGEQVLSVRRY